jgi:hypothetical protein
MFRHDHIANHYEPMALADFLHDFEEEVSAVCSSKERPSLIATGGDEVKISCPVVTM